MLVRAPAACRDVRRATGCAEAVATSNARSDRRTTRSRLEGPVRRSFVTSKVTLDRRSGRFGLREQVRRSDRTSEVTSTAGTRRYAPWRWWRITLPGSTTTRSNRIGRRGSGGPGRVPSTSASAAARSRARLVWWIVSSGRPKARLARHRTSTNTRARGGPGSTAIRSISARPTRTWRPRIAQPAPARRSSTNDSAASPSRWADVRTR